MTATNLDPSLCRGCRWIGGDHDPATLPLPNEVEDRDGDVWRREPGSVDSFRLMLGGQDHVATLDELRVEHGPIHRAGTAL